MRIGLKELEFRMLLFIHTGISNISLASFLGGLTVFVAVRILCSEQKSNRLALYLGLAFGGAILSRIACIYLLPVCGGVLLYKWMEEKSPGAFVRSVLLFSLGTTVVAGWWFLRNWVYYDDPIFWKFHQDVIGTGFARTEPVTASSLLLSGIYLNASFWAFFGKQQYHAGIAEYAVYFIFQALALVGSFHLVLSKRITRFPKRGFMTMAAAAFMAITIVLWIQTQIRAPQGRYFFMAITPIAIVLSGGLLQLIPAQTRPKAAIALTLFLFVLCIYLLLRFWVPRYAPNI